MQWLSSLLSAFVAGLKALALYGAFKYGKAEQRKEQLEAERDAIQEHAHLERDIHTASDAELAERMRKYTRK